MTQSSKLRRAAIGAAVLIAVQAAAVGGYLLLHKPAPREPFAAEALAPLVAPELAFERPDGSQHALGELRGKLVLVHFWATWCQPCVKELPGLLELAAAFERNGRFALVAISIDDEWADIGGFVGAEPGALPTSLARLAGSDDHRRFGVTTLPDSYLVDAEGRIIARYAGARDWRSQEARAELERHLSALGSPRP